MNLLHLLFLDTTGYNPKYQDISYHYYILYFSIILVERFGGEMELASQENKGSVFTVRLPLHEDWYALLALLASIKSVDLTVLQQPMTAINVGLESFAESLIVQDALVIQVDW